MADRVRIDCVSKTYRSDPHERISEVGGPNRNGGRWKLQQSQAVSGVESGKWAFYVEQPSAQVVAVVVARRLGKSTSRRPPTESSPRVAGASRLFMT